MDSLSSANERSVRSLCFKHLEFLVVQDIFATETTEYADVILPGTAFAEKNGTFVNSDRRVSRVRERFDPASQIDRLIEVLQHLRERAEMTALGNAAESPAHAGIASRTACVAMNSRILRPNAVSVGQLVGEVRDFMDADVLGIGWGWLRSR